MKKAVVAQLIGIVFFGFTAGTTFSSDGLAMLKNDFSARITGMGECDIGSTRNPNVTMYNPAGVVSIEQFMVSFGHTVFWENVRFETGYMAAPLNSRLYIHSGFRFAVVDNLEGRENPTSEPFELFDAHDVSMKVGLTYRLTDKVAAGMSAGWFLEKIEAWRGSAFNVDFGVLVLPTERLRLGASVTNLGSSFYLEKSGIRGSRDISLPTTYRLGGAYRFQPFLGALELVVRDDKARLHIGAEKRWHRQFAVRGGYMFNYDTKSFTLGASFTKRNISIDYAFVPYSGKLGSSHVFNITFSL